MLTIKGTFTFQEEIKPAKNTRGYAKALEDTPIGIMMARGYSNTQIANVAGRRSSTVCGWRLGDFTPKAECQRAVRGYLIGIGVLPPNAHMRATYPPKAKPEHKMVYPDAPPTEPYATPKPLQNTAGKTYTVAIPDGHWNTFEAMMKAHGWTYTCTGVVKTKDKGAYDTKLGWQDTSCPTPPPSK